MKSTVLFCTSSISLDGGGIASYANDLCYCLSERYDFIIVTNTLPVEGINQKTVCFDMNDLSIGNIKRFIQLVSDIKPDVILNSNFPVAVLAGPYLPDNCLFISVSHFVNGPLSWAAGLNASYQDKIIALSTYGKINIDNTFSVRDKNKTIVLLNSVPPLPPVNSIEDKRSRKILKIVYPGGCSYMKSAGVVYRTLRKLLKTDLEFEFFWLGHTKVPGADWPLSRTKDISDCFDMSDTRIKYVGYLERSQARKVIADANIFLLPSLGEGCPISLLEAMSAGCIPIISDAKHGSLDIIEDGKNGLVVKQGSSKALVKKIKEVLINPQKYSYIYKKTIDCYCSMLSTERWTKEMDGLLSSTLSHTCRLPSISFRKLKADVFHYKIMLIRYYLKDRFIYQMSHLVLFNVLHHSIDGRAL